MGIVSSPDPFLYGHALENGCGDKANRRIAARLDNHIRPGNVCRERAVCSTLCSSYSLVPRPHPQNGKGSGDIARLSWLC